MTTHTHTWVKLLGDAVMFRCSGCNALGHGRAPGIKGASRRGTDEIIPYTCVYCGEPATVRGTSSSYCETHRNGRPRLLLECAQCGTRKSRVATGWVEDPLTSEKFNVCEPGVPCKCGGTWRYVR